MLHLNKVSVLSFSNSPMLLQSSKKSSLDNSFLTSQSIILVIKANLKLFISIQPLRVMTGPYFQSLCEMLEILVITCNDWPFQSLREMTETFSHYA